MSNFDIGLIVAFSGFVFYGLFFGLIRVVGSLAGVVVGLWAANYYYLALFDWGKSFWSFGESIGKIATFIVIFLVIRKIISLLFTLLDGIFDFISMIPFLTTINRLGGLALGFLEGGLVIGAILYIVIQYMPTSTLGTMIDTSQIAPFLLSVTGFVLKYLGSSGILNLKI